jgi:hypothetical protein
LILSFTLSNLFAAPLGEEKDQRGITNRPVKSLPIGRCLETLKLEVGIEA